MSSNLPNWPDADSVYGRVYARLSDMARNGHVRIGQRIVGRRMETQNVCFPSRKMNAIIKALNDGDEGTLKAFLQGANEEARLTA